MDFSTTFAAHSAQGSAKKAAAQPKKARPRRSSSHNHGKAPLSSEDDGYAMGSYDNEPVEEGSATPSWVMNSATESKSPSSPLTSAPQSPNAPQEMIAPIPFHLHTLSGVPSAMPNPSFAPLHSSNGHSHMTPTMPPLGHFPPTMAFNQGPGMSSFGQMPPASAPPSLAPAQQHSDAIARILALQQANSLPLNASSSSSSSGGHLMNSSNGYAQPPPNFVPIGFDMPRTMSPTAAGNNVSTPPVPFFPPSNMPMHNPFMPMHAAPPHVSSPSLSAPPAFHAAPIFPQPAVGGVNKNGFVMQSPPPIFTVPQSPTTPTYHDASAAAQRHLKTSNKSVPSPRSNIHAHHNFGVPAQP